MRHEFGSEWAAFKRPIDPAAAVKTASLKFSLDEKHFSYRMKDIKDKPKSLRLFISGDANGKVKLQQDNGPLGEMQIANGKASFNNLTLSSLEKFELIFDSNTFTDLWMVVDWS